MTANTIISANDSCISPGNGLVTTWTLEGSTGVYSGTLTSTDGYKIKATFQWQSTTTVTGTTMAGEQPSATNDMVMGTCVVNYDENDQAETSMIYDNGNHAICHWIYVDFGPASTAGTASTGGQNWGETKYMTAWQWGVAGENIIGNKVKTSTLGTAIGTTDFGMVLDPTSVFGGIYAAQDYSMTWYQPKYYTQYAAQHLRRYSKGDKVRGYCVSWRLLSTTTNKLDGIVPSSTIVSLSSASALAAAITFGAASLVI